MDEERKVDASHEESGQSPAETSDESSSVDSPEFVKLEDFRAFQAAKDREIAAERRRRQQLEQQLQAIAQRYEESIEDPAQREALRRQRLEAQLRYYQYQENLAKERKYVAEEYGVPEKALTDAKTHAELVKAALTWLKEQREAALAKAERQKRRKEAAEAEEQGGDVVSTATASPADWSKLNAKQIDAEMARLKKVAQQGGSKGARARVQLLKLEALKQRRSAPRSRV